MSLAAVVVIIGNITFGTIHFNQELTGGPVLISGQIQGITTGQHGLHVHEFGDTSGGCSSTGAHFNPENMTHGGPNDTIRHVGDLGNIVADASGVATVNFTDTVIQLEGPHNIVGRDADPDDLGKGGDQGSQTTGNAGARIGCGVIALAAT